MSGLGNKEVFSRNLRALMERFGKERKQVCEDLDFKYTTFADWYNGKKYPRIDNIEKLARYFGVLKSDLIEDKGGTFSIDAPAPTLFDKYREVLAEEGVRVLFDADANMTEEQIKEIVEFIKFKRRTEEP